MSKIIECPKCRRVFSIIPEDKTKIPDSEGKKKQLNAGHAMVINSEITCVCGKVL